MSGGHYPPLPPTLKLPYRGVPENNPLSGKGLRKATPHSPHSPAYFYARKKKNIPPLVPPPIFLFFSLGEKSKGEWGECPKTLLTLWERAPSLS